MKHSLVKSPHKLLLFLSYFVLSLIIVLGSANLNSSLAEGARAAPDIKILALGDSLTAGYALSVEESFTYRLERRLEEDLNQGFKVINGGVSGDTTAGGLARVDWLLFDKPDFAIVTLGGNDGLRGLSVRQSQKNLEQIIQKFHDNKIPVLLSGMLAPPNLGQEFAQEFNQIYSALAAKYNLVYFPFFLKDVAGQAAYNQADGIHPNEKGIKIIVQNILPYIKLLIEKEQKPT